MEGGRVAARLAWIDIVAVGSRKGLESLKKRPQGNVEPEANRIRARRLGR